jgi:hypothetical protein
MNIFIVFALSGLAIALLLIAKVIEIKRQRSLLLLRIISIGDTHMRQASHRFTLLYSDVKEKMIFMFKRQIPLHSRRLWNKFVTFTQETAAKNLVKMRDIKLRRSKNQDISQFFKSISDSGKTNGEINHILEEGSQMEE